MKAAITESSPARPLRVALLAAPFGALAAPYISIPTLAAQLKAWGCRVAALDGNLALYRELLAPERLRAGLARAQADVATLDAEPSLPFTAACRLAYALRAVDGARRHGEALFTALETGGELPPGAAPTALHLASYPHFPEGLEILEPNRIVTHTTPFHKFSSRQVLEALDDLDTSDAPVEPDTPGTQPTPGGSLLAGFMARWLPRALNEAFADARPDVLGVSIAFPDQLLAALSAARTARRMGLARVVVMGGSFVTCHMRSMENARLLQEADVWVLDEGETPLRKILDRLSKLEAQDAQDGPAPCPDSISNRNPPRDWDDVPGVLYAREGRVVRTPPQSAPPSLSSLPPPDYDCFDLDAYPTPRRAMPILLRLSRGCPWGRCAFCRTRLPMIAHHEALDAETVWAHLTHVLKATGSRIVQFTDDAADPAVLESMARRILEAGLEVAWTANIRMDAAMTIERAMLLRKAGCLFLNAGLEAADDALLKRMRKGVTMAMVERLLSTCAWAGLPVTAYMIVGYPGETVRDAVRGFAVVRRLMREGKLQGCIYSQFQVVAHSRIAEEPARFGVTSVTPPADLDLDPPLFEFEGEGMDRAMARRLAAVFTQAAATCAKQSSHPAARTSSARSTTPQTPPPAPLLRRYDPFELARRLRRGGALRQGAMSHQEWLDHMDAILPPLTPSHR